MVVTARNIATLEKSAKMFVTGFVTVFVTGRNRIPIGAGYLLFLFMMGFVTAFATGRNRIPQPDGAGRRRRALARARDERYRS